MTAPLSEHTVHVPPRQTVHETATLSEDARSVVLTGIGWTEISPDFGVRQALHLAVGGCKLPAGATTIDDFEPTKTPRIEVGNWSDYPIVVAFEIWGKP